MVVNYYDLVELLPAEKALQAGILGEDHFCQILSPLVQD